jgi:hypothetical protein
MIYRHRTASLKNPTDENFAGNFFAPFLKLKANFG